MSLDAWATDGYWESEGTTAGTSAPVITVVSPQPSTTPGAAGGFSIDYAVASKTPIIVDITDPDGSSALIYVHVMAVYLDGTVYSVYHANIYNTPFITNSTQTSVTNGRRLSIRPDTAWPGANQYSNLAVSLIIDAVGNSGTLTSKTLFWELPLATPAQPVLSNPPPSVGAADHLTGALGRLPEQFKLKST